MTTAIRLCEMSDEAYAAYVPRRTREYAAEGAEATGMPLDEAVEQATSQIDGLLTDGLQTPGQHFRTLRDTADEAVGVLWFATDPDSDPPLLFLYDVVIDEAHRGRGLGTAAMLALEEEARARSLAAIRLHVFTTNLGAIRLYERLGYRVTYEGTGGQQMTKELAV